MRVGYLRKGTYCVMSNRKRCPLPRTKTYFRSLKQLSLLQWFELEIIVALYYGVEEREMERKESKTHFI